MKEKQVILIAEDEEINRRILKKILQEKYTVLEDENGAEAWDILFEKRNDIDAVITDIIMPVMDGYALLTKIRQASMTELPTIVTTGQADVSSEQKALDAGAWDFVSKPYNARVLLSRLRNAIARRQLSVYQKMQRMAAHDPLTGLHNRNRMFEKTRKMIDEHPNTKFAFLRIDIDHFALYNTSFGETEGDNLLIFLAQCISATAVDYPLSTYGRISSDVFCVCCAYHDDMDSIRNDVKQIQSQLMAYRTDYSLKLSAGVYIIDEPTLAVDDYYFRASIAAQKCKNQYETHLAAYDADSIQKIADEIEITNEMQTALDEKQFVVFLQPKYNLSTETCCGAEALVRWKHPTKGMISPGAFIPVFEKNGFIAKLDYYMWENTCALLQKWSANGNTPFPVSVNISRISLYNPKIVDLMKGLVRKYNIPPVLLQLEVTESAYMTSPELMLDTIHGLREAGFTILMDDFGSGYSSLNTLKDTEVDILKIDMKFLPVGNEVEKAEIILASIIKMANWLGLSVIVEGVETCRQRDFIEGTGCNFVQGYYFSRPIPNEEYEEKYVRSSTMAANENAQLQNTEVVPKHKMTVLVIDDSEIDQAILQENFQTLYHIHVCDSAEAGLAYLKKHMKRVKLRACVHRRFKSVAA